MTAHRSKPKRADEGPFALKTKKAAGIANVGRNGKALTPVASKPATGVGGSGR